MVQTQDRNCGRNILKVTLAAVFWIADVLSLAQIGKLLTLLPWTLCMLLERAIIKRHYCPFFSFEMYTILESVEDRVSFCQLPMLLWTRFMSWDDLLNHLQKTVMFYPGPPPPVVDSRLNKDQSRMEKGGELLPAHKTALVQVFKILMLPPSVMFLPKFDFQSLYLSWRSLCCRLLLRRWTAWLVLNMSSRSDCLKCFVDIVISLMMNRWFMNNFVSVVHFQILMLVNIIVMFVMNGGHK